MKDESKAQWPDEILHQIVWKKKKNTTGWYLVQFANKEKTLYLGELDCPSLGIAEARAKQVRALPAMVALLKEAALIKEGDDYLAIVDKAKHILAQIGEMK